VTTEILEYGVTLRACVFTLAGTTYAFDVKSVEEVVVFDDATPVPRAPAYVLGVANLRGRVVPLVDVRALLGLAAGRPGRDLTGLVIRAGGWQVAMNVDAVVGLEEFEHVTPYQDATIVRGRRLVVGALRRRDTVAMLLDAGELLGALRGAAADGSEGRMESMRGERATG
jgi:purine-binding chemotaxis protein CheW